MMGVMYWEVWRHCYPSVACQVLLFVKNGQVTSMCSIHEGVALFTTVRSLKIATKTSQSWLEMLSCEPEGCEIVLFTIGASAQSVA